MYAPGRRTSGAVALGCAVAAVVALAAVPLPVLAHTNDVHADPQVSADGTVVVETVFLAEDGWLALYRNASGNGTYTGLLGRTAVDGGDGLERDVAVTVSDDRWRTFGPNATVHLVVHHGDGDGDFEPRGDDPVLSSFGAPVADSFALRRADAPAVVTAQGFAPQEANGSTVVVRRATLPTDGHLVVRNATGAGTGRVLAHASLSAGTHRNVTLDLDGTALGPADGDELDVSLRAALYRDDGDGTFDAGDRPVRAGNGTVGTTFRVRLDDVVSNESHDEHSEGTHEHSDETNHEHSEGSTRSVTPTPTGTPASPDTVAPTAPPTATDPAGTTPAGTGGDGAGFDPTAVLVALSVLVAGALARRGRR